MWYANMNTVMAAYNETLWPIYTDIIMILHFFFKYRKRLR